MFLLEPVLSLLVGLVLVLGVVVGEVGVGGGARSRGGGRGGGCSSCSGGRGGGLLLREVDSHLNIAGLPLG